MIPYQVYYICSMLSLIATLINVLQHNLALSLANFFFAVFNWYIAEWKRGLKNAESGSDDDRETKE